MAQRSFHLYAVVPVDPEVAIDYLADLARHRGLNPYLEEAVITDEGDSDKGHWQKWRIHDRPPLGPFRYSLRFGARLTRTSPTTYTSSVLAAPGCTIEAVTHARLGDTPGTALVDERSVVTAPAPFLSYMARHAELAHARIFRLLPAVVG
jgi:hypothetical protein